MICCAANIALVATAVQVHSTIDPAPSDPNQPLWIDFWHYDVDDPSSNQPPVDNEGTGSDNRGLGWWAMAGQGGGTYSEVPVSATGHAASIFDVSPKPGDNFRVNAQTVLQFGGGDEEEIVGAAIYGITVPQGVTDGRIVRTDGQPLRTQEVTPMLTVWRRFHLERDSMSAPVAYRNTAEGQVQSVQQLAGYWILTANYWALDHVLQQNRFVPGKMIRLVTGAAYPIAGNSAEVAGLFSVTVQGGASPNPGDTVDLYDDDFDLNSTPPSVRPGMLPQIPDFSVAQTAFRSAYVEVLDAQSSWNQSNKSFWPYAVAPNRSMRDAYGKGRSLYWIGYVLGEFQYDQILSEDPNDEEGRLGTTYPAPGEILGSAIFFETIRDHSYNKLRVIGHELAHSFDGKEDIFEGNVLAVFPDLPRRHFLVAGDILSAGLLITPQTSRVDIVGMEGGSGILAAYLYDAGNTQVWLMQDLPSPVQIGNMCNIWSVSLLGQDANILSPKTINEIRRATSSPMP